MVDAQYLAVLHKVVARLKHCDAAWVITGSLGMALQGMDISVHDIDIQTDQNGAYEIEGKFPEHIVTPVRYLPSERIRSHLGKLEIDGVRVEVMGAVQKRIDERTWEEPVDVKQHREWVKVDGMQIPVLSLEYEYEAYLKLGRIEKAGKIREWLQSQENKWPPIWNITAIHKRLKPLLQRRDLWLAIHQERKGNLLFKNVDQRFIGFSV